MSIATHPTAAATLTLDDVATLTGLTRRTVARAAQVGHLRSVRIGGRRLTQREWVTLWLEIHEPGARQPHRWDSTVSTHDPDVV